MKNFCHIPISNFCLISNLNQPSFALKQNVCFVLSLVLSQQALIKFIPYITDHIQSSWILCVKLAKYTAQLLGFIHISMPLCNRCKTIQSSFKGLLHISGISTHPGFWIHALKCYQRHVIIVQKCLACCELQLKPKYSVHYTYTQNRLFNQVMWCACLQRTKKIYIWSSICSSTIQRENVPLIQNSSKKSLVAYNVICFCV